MMYEAFDLSRPWNAPHNQQVSQTALYSFHGPEQSGARSEEGTTNYLAVVGPECAWRGAEPVSLSELGDPSKVIMVVEVADATIPWAKPQDLEHATMAKGINTSDRNGLSSLHGRGWHLFKTRIPGANVLFADGRVEWLPATTSPAELRRMLTIARDAQ
jgi:prepilin-type processing-associated H-X9-DG protein